MTVVGVDGWKRGWVAAVAEGRAVELLDFPTFAEILVAYPGTIVAVDMPITTTEGPRDVDVAGRVWLREHGGPWQSIFLAPTTRTVAAYERTLTHAQAMKERGDAPGTSIQAWNLIPAIVEVRDALLVHPGSTVIEAHPECSFRLLDDRVGLASKKTGLGAGRRLRALSRIFDLDLADAPPDVPVDDLLDACALAWTAARYKRGDHLTVPVGATSAPRIVI